MSDQNLHAAGKVLMVRVQNGWIVRDNKNNGCVPGDDCFVFESTESLQKQLVTLLGKSGWTVTSLPARDEKGHFLKASTP